MVALKSHELVPTGYTPLDQQHEVQIELMDRLDAALRAGLDPEAVWDALDRLVEHLRAHFASEQRLMRLFRYPMTETHVLEHEHAFNLLDRLRTRCAQNDARLSGEVLEGLRRWLVDHVETRDVPLGQFLMGQAGKA